MGAILDYLDEYGNTRFDEMPFGVVDALVLCQLSYLSLEGIVDAGRAGVTMACASEAYFDTRSAEEVYEAKGLASPLTSFLLQKAGGSIRFGAAVLTQYVSLFDEGVHLQFAAYCVELPDGSVFVAFRGTDDTLIGWQEDFEMGFKTVPAQQAALAYLNEAAARFGGRLLRVGGHSKGANLAVYSSAKCAPEVQGRIMSVFDFDGPGFLPEVLSEAELRPLRRRIVSFVPEHCIIGALFRSGKPQAIVKSSETGVGQHDILSWQIDGTQLVRAKRIDESARRFNRLFARWMDSVPMGERAGFIDDVFGALRSLGISGFRELRRADPALVKKLPQVLDRLEPKNRFIVEELVFALAGNLLRSSVPLLARLVSRPCTGKSAGEPERYREPFALAPSLEGFSRWKRHDKWRKRFSSVSHLAKLIAGNDRFRGVAFSALGIALMANADAAHPVVPLVLMGAVAVAAVYLLARVFKAKSKGHAADPAEAALGGVLAVVSASAIVFQGGLALLSNVALGCAIVAYGVSLARRVVARHATGGSPRVDEVLLGACSFPLGVAILLNPAHQLEQIAFAAGVFVLIKGLFDFGRSIWLEARGLCR